MEGLVYFVVGTEPVCLSVRLYMFGGVKMEVQVAKHKLQVGIFTSLNSLYWFLEDD
jgi:hypothetical protein